jgi:diguanylate cyclase (GGDEF)-like protein
VEHDDRNAVLEILGALEASASVVKAQMRDAAGRPLAMQLWSREAPFGGSDVEIVRHPIHSRGEQIGSVELSVEMGALRAHLLDYLGAIAAAVIAAAMAGYLMLSPLLRRLLEPLDRLSRTARRVADTGDFGLRAPQESRDEIGQLARGFNDMLAEIQSRDAALADELVQRREAEGRLAKLAHFDPVTHLPNRHYFNERISNVLEDSRILGARAALLLIDVDDFKLVNDSLGHHVGDRLLEEIGRGIKQQVRATDTVARLGGDEFAVILEHVRGRDEPRHVAEKVIAALSRPLTADGHSVHVGVSVGIAVFPGDAANVAGLLQRADTALYDAKARGKRGFRFFEPEMDHRMRRRLEVEEELRRALGGDELALVYQPQVNLASGSHAGLEALVRWRHPVRGPVPPGEFIPVAEESGLIAGVGKFVIDTALAQARVWLEQRLEAGQMAINVSSRQFESDDFVEFVLDALRRHGVAPGMLELEITESLVMGGADAVERIEALHRAGVRFAIDDFGTGYSSLSYLKRAPISTIKIDRHFTRGLGTDAEDRAITQAIIGMGQSLDLKTVAEGVESGAGLDLLRRMGCTLAQGYVIAPPLEAAAVPAFVRTWTKPMPAAPAALADAGSGERTRG